MQNKYPLWKNVLLVIIAILGFVYALPNLYREEPVIQISSSTNEDMAAVSQRVKTLLSQSALPFQSLSAADNRVEVRFDSTDTQLKAQDVIKNGLGKTYTVALNLLASTPRWLSNIGAEPMKQGDRKSVV
jgi:preprotein translocase subunit SecD